MTASSRSRLGSAFSSSFTRVRRRRAVLAAALVAAVAAAGCGSDEKTTTTTAAADPNAKLTIVAAWGVDALDPAVNGQIGGYGATETLTSANGKAEIKPLLATSWEHDPDLRTWTVKLRDGVTFQNGRPVDADAVVASMNRQLKKNSGAQQAVPGAKVSAEGKDTVVIRLRSPSLTFPSVLADKRLFPIYDAATVEAAANPGKALVGKGAFTGPYEVTGMTANELQFKRYDGYWQGKPPLAAITARTVPEGQSRLAAVRSGKADIATVMMSPEMKRATAKDDRATLKVSDVALDSVRVYYDQEEGPLQDRRVRRAITYGLNNREIADRYLDGTHEPGTGLFPRNYPGAIVNETYDVEAAKRLLDEAGWKADADGVRRRDGKPLTLKLLNYTEQPDLKATAIGVQTQLKALGIDVKISEREYSDEMYANHKDWDLAPYVEYSVSSTGIPDQYIRRALHTKGSANPLGLGGPELDRALDELQVATTEEQRQKLLRRIQEIFIDEQAYGTMTTLKRDGSVVGPRFRSYIPSHDSYGLYEVDYATRPG